MPITVDKNEERANDLVAGGGLKPATLMLRQRCAEELDSFIRTNYGKSLEAILETKDGLKF